MSRLEIIDRLIEQHGLLGKKCELHRSRCMCGHYAGIHEVLDKNALPRNWQYGRCHGGRKGDCDCPRFRPYDYAKETQAKLKKFRTFALDVIEQIEADR